MKVLGIESTAHTFSVGVVDGKKILSNVIDSFTTKKGGIKPYDVAEHHTKVCHEVLEKALKEAKLSMKDIDLIAFSQGPGLGHTLRIGAFFARSLALRFKKKIVGVNHCIAHLSIGELTGAKDPVLLYASGVNTQVIAYEGGKYRIFGETLDMGVGNFLDSVGRLMDLGFPGGPKLEKLALKGKKFIEMPYVVKGMDVSFGGLYSFVKNKLGKFRKEDLAYSIQETIFAMLLEVAERAMAHTGKKELLLGGGVACNSRFQEMAQKMCAERKAKCFIPEKKLLIDNGAMIGYQGLLEYKAGKRQKISDTKIKPYWRTDEVKVNWK
ncbi:MAG: bifunctional N(6)-L-threonylcarbamoyladenine synthase/serine/threonine protein kinase [Nanoarchaeota archaeon]|nr:bifunctional N(6)-L-threonylcarbamoyladenine synthase/serine/threonine protein kinase [Nanoarchaeota archaeon]